MARREKLLDALRRVADGTLQAPRGERDDDILGIEARLHAEAASDVADDDAHGLRAHAEDVAQLVAKTGRRLAARPEREALRSRIERRQRRSRLDRRSGDALVDEIERHDVRGARKRGRGLPRISMARLA